MNVLQNIQSFIYKLTDKQFKTYATIAGASIALIAGIMIYRYYRTTNILIKRINFVNIKRKEIKDLLERFETVKKQQTEVNALLEKDKEFKIAGYFNTVITKLKLETNKTREPETSSEELDNGYTEIKLYASFSQMNMQKLVELLDTLEQNERIYTKELEMYKPGSDQTINVNLLIATLMSTVEVKEAE